MMQIYRRTCDGRLKMDYQSWGRGVFIYQLSRIHNNSNQGISNKWIGYFYRKQGWQGTPGAAGIADA